MKERLLKAKDGKKATATTSTVVPFPSEKREGEEDDAEPRLPLCRLHPLTHVLLKVYSDCGARSESLSLKERKSSRLAISFTDAAAAGGLMAAGLCR